MRTNEKRNSKRLKKPFTARIRPHLTETISPAKWDIVTMKDLSVSGMCFNYTKTIQIGTVLEIKIALPLNEVQCIGEVRRIDDNLDQISRRIPAYWIAVRFIQLDADQADIISKNTLTSP